jgi:hypothetical protein
VLALAIGLEWTSSIATDATASTNASGGEAANMRVAEDDAALLLSRLRLPTGVTRSPVDPTGAAALLAQPAVGPPTTPNVIDRHGWWLVPGEPRAVLDWIEAHRPHGSRMVGSGVRGGGGGPVFRSALFGWSPMRNVLGSRLLVVEVVQAPNGATALRADAQVVWLIPRPAFERVPARARVLTVVMLRKGEHPSAPVRITNHAKVRKVAALIDRLPRVQPGVTTCPISSIGLRLTFRATPHGRPLARAVAAPEGCGVVSFAIRGHRKPSLHGWTFVHDVEARLGIRLTDRS